jgi:4-methylaminobutanoate oxidase (formaldehyde-forming)
MQRAAEGKHAFIADVTGGFAQINIQGPNSRALLQSITTADLSNEAFPFRTAREIDLGFARALCIRITYLGELGYELYIPAEMAGHTYERIVEAGRRFDLKHVGLKSLASLRMEKGYRDFGHDIDNTDSVLEAGLSFAVAFDKPDFIGKGAVEAKKAEGPLTKRLIQIKLDDPEPMMFHAEIVSRNGKELGYTRAASYGHTLGAAVGLAMIEADEPITQAFLDDGQWTVNIAGNSYTASASLKPMYDPTNARIHS